MKLGSSEVSALYLGGSEVEKVYKGSTEVFSAAPSGIPLSTTNINITYNVESEGEITRTLVKQSDTFWYNERFGPNDPGTCEVYRFALKYENSQWEFSIYFNTSDEGNCSTGFLELKSTNAGASSSIPVSGWSTSITITAA